ncbi:unnamed protein product [Strongylus vulgaris]|uniref:Reverse transcriptase/retrotransposon-derived protein RNase H-like domain-containing protein n=1 Tax=Strongylus vulgaris TaxID=40348 RepID=A0A3P7J9V8_STRVU|nr:unnamed protein product [Strongylus vulgaris]
MTRMISTAPVLSQPDVDKARDSSKPFVIRTDASTYGSSAVLLQDGEDKGHCIPTLSRHKVWERRYYIMDLEAFAVVYAVSRLHMFLFPSDDGVNSAFQALMCQRALTWLLTHKAEEY